jgi:cell division septum initiation protein DivIVA
LSDHLQILGVSEEEVKKIVESAEDGSDAVVKLKEAMANVKPLQEEDPDTTKQMSIAVTQFASAAMGAYAAVSSVQGAFEAWGAAIDGSGTGLEAFGATLSAAMGVM